MGINSIRLPSKAIFTVLVKSAHRLHAPTKMPARTTPFRPFALLQRVLQLAFFCLALSAFFLLLRIMTTERKLPTTVLKRITRMTGMRIAQTRGGKKECSGWSSSTKGWHVLVLYSVGAKFLL